MVEKECHFDRNAIHQLEHITVFPREVFLPETFLRTNPGYTERTYAVHYYAATWYDAAELERVKRLWAVKRELFSRIMHV